MAYNMVFLLIPDGVKTYENGGAGGTLTSGGADDYTTGYWAGVQAYNYNNTFDALYGNGLLPTTISNSGWCAIRFKTNVAGGGTFTVPWRMGSTTTDDYLALSAAAAEASYAAKLGYLKDGGSSSSTFSVGAVNGGVERFFYCEWNGTATKIRKDNDTPVTGTRVTPDGNVAAPTHGQLRIGSYENGLGYLNGTLSGIAFGTGTLTTDEIDRLYNATEPWTWNMPSDPPVVDAGSNGTATAGAAFTRSGSFTDADSSGPWTATVDYDEGAGAVPLTLDGFTFDLANTYDTPGTYTIVVAVTDDGGSEGTDTFDVVVEANDPPVVSAGPDDAVVVSTPWTRAGSFTDADSASWTATVDYDDGAGTEPLTLDGLTFALSYTWATTGTKSVVVSVEDDAGQIGTDTVQVTVSLAGITGGFIVSEVEGTHATAPRIALT